ncbi:MAG: Co2+/Mg2+ efflux protein ApaG [Gammaproteobacteria bacterium]
MTNQKENPDAYIDVNVTTQYIEEQSSPEENRFVFSYTITIHNTGSLAAKLLTRHWIINDANGNVQEVHGEGVVGEQPYLRPDDSFEYTSGTVIETPVGSMEGSYQMVTDDGFAFDANIPAFTLSQPNALH